MLIALKSAILGVVQGITEFLPISSSGHLILASRLFGWHDKWLPGATTSGTNTTALAFSVALHMGTLLALLIYFNREWIVLIKGFFTGFASRPSAWDSDQKLAWLIVLATIPAALVGALATQNGVRRCPSISSEVTKGEISTLFSGMEIEDLLISISARSDVHWSAGASPHKRERESEPDSQKEKKRYPYLDAGPADAATYSLR